MAIQFYLTNVGRTAALNATLVGLDLQIKYIAVGSGQYNAATAAPTKTALTTELERYLVNGGEIEPTTHTLRFTVNLNSTITADIYEIGLFDENNVLFAVASSTTTPLVQLINEVITIITFGFSLDEVDNITLMLDVNSPLAVTLMNQHTAHEHPHAQYKRTNDDTERLKVANATDSKDAINKEQLDAEATARANADTDLQNTKAEKNGDNTQRFKASTALYLDEVVNKAQLDDALSATLGDLNLGNKADKNGNSGEFFNVKNGVDSSHAVNKGQLDTEATARANADTALQNSKAELAGSSAQQFSVADGSTQYHAVNKGQLDNKAELAGSSTQQFSVADGTSGSHAVNKGQLDNKAELAGSSAQQFSVADGSTQYHAVNKGQLDTKADKNGSVSETFSVADGTSGSHAVNKGQLDTKADKNGSVSETFSVATATTDAHAVRKDQFDAKTGVATDTIAGIVEKATQAEMNAGTNNVWPDAATIFNGFVQSGTTSGYIKLPEWMGGLIIQWASGTAAPATTIDFPITFPTACYVVVGCDRGSYNGFGTTGSPNQSGFVLASDTPSLQYQYVAIGK